MARYINVDRVKPDCMSTKGGVAISQSQLANQPNADVIERSKINKAIEESYKKGLTDAWECARKIGNNSQLGLEEMGFDFSELDTYYNPSWWVVLNYDVFKVLEIFKRNIGE